MPFGVVGFEIEDKTASSSADGDVISSRMVLDAEDHHITITWTNGNSNGSTIENYEVYVAAVRTHKERDCKLAAIEAKSTCDIEYLNIRERLERLEVCRIIYYSFLTADFL